MEIVDKTTRNEYVDLEGLEPGTCFKLKNALEASPKGLYVIMGLYNNFIHCFDFRLERVDKMHPRKKVKVCKAHVVIDEWE